MTTPIYLDYAATTPVDPRVVEVMKSHLSLDGIFGNASATQSTHGRLALDAIEKASNEVGNLLNVSGREFIWTSGATEAINLAIKGTAEYYKNHGKKHLVTYAAEHHAVLSSYEYLETKGFSVTYLKGNADGTINFKELEEAITEETLLLSVILVNNETGIIHSLEKLSQLSESKSCLLHIDAVQGAGKISIDLQKTPVDLLSLSGHKLYGPKGVGALYVRKQPKARLSSQVHGGSQQNQLRAGTLPTHQIVGMGEAFRLAKEVFEKDHAHNTHLQDIFITSLSQHPNIHFNTDAALAVPNIMNIQIKGVDNFLPILVALNKNISLAQGSACNSIKMESSHVLLSMGLAKQEASQSLRFSWGRFTDASEIHEAVKILKALL
jgi:cysteine desulfurase